MASHPGLSVDSEYQRLRPPSAPGVAAARAFVSRHVSPSVENVSDELIAERRREVAQERTVEM
jgi:hypothetical protein